MWYWMSILENFYKREEMSTPSNIGACLLQNRNPTQSLITETEHICIDVKFNRTVTREQEACYNEEDMIPKAAFLT